MGALLAVGGAACAARTPPAPMPDVFPPFVPDVSDDEWNAAIPAKGSRIASPHLLAGPAHSDVRAVLRRGESARTTVAHIIRVDGSIGLYRITASTNPQFTAKVIEIMRAQVYEPPLLNGSPVAVRGEVTFQFSR
jgi:outer membrane biosynthesis protein TonB